MLHFSGLAVICFRRLLFCNLYIETCKTCEFASVKLNVKPNPYFLFWKWTSISICYMGIYSSLKPEKWLYFIKFIFIKIKNWGSPNKRTVCSTKLFNVLGKNCSLEFLNSSRLVTTEQNGFLGSSRFWQYGRSCRIICIY